MLLSFERKFVAEFDTNSARSWLASAPAILSPGLHSASTEFDLTHPVYPADSGPWQYRSLSGLLGAHHL